MFVPKPGRSPPQTPKKHCKTRTFEDVGAETGLSSRMLRSLVELPWMEPVSLRDLEVVYERLITAQLVTPRLAYLPPGVLCT
eukprot:2177521-Amphidinium_carterae.1